MDSIEGNASFGPNAAEAALLQAAQGGDMAAFEDIVMLYQKRVYGVVYRMTSRHDVAEDLGQEAFVRFWKNLARFDPKLPIFPFVRKIAVNLTISWFGSRARKTQLVEDEHLETGTPLTPRSAQDPLENLALHETRAALAEAIAGLTPERRMVLTLRAVEGLSYEAIAEEMNCSIGTVMSRLFRARADVKAELERRLGRNALADWERDATGAAESAPVTG